jgi:hypothetical protein
VLKIPCYQHDSYDSHCSDCRDMNLAREGAKKKRDASRERYTRLLESEQPDNMDEE